MGGNCSLTGPNTCDGGTCVLQTVADGGTEPTCTAGACDVVLQDCAGGQKCSYQLDGGRGCGPDGTLVENGACGTSVAGECVKGTTCVQGALSDGGMGSTCAKFCRTDGNCNGGQRCYVTLNIAGTMEKPLVCADPPRVCDVLKQDCPMTNQGCYVTSAGSACYNSGTTANGAGCMFANDCVKGSTCASTNGVATCRTLCAFPSGTPSCGDAGMCRRLTGYEDAGTCL